MGQVAQRCLLDFFTLSLRRSTNASRERERERESLLFSDYAFLKELESLPTTRLCELSILHELSTLGLTLPKPYESEEHEKIWEKITALFARNREKGALMDHLRLFMTQFSPKENQISPRNSDHISQYVRAAVEIYNILDKPSNILEMGGNYGILSYTLHILGNKVVCTDLHHGMLGKSINPYKIGTWIREHFIGLHTVDSYAYPADGTSYSGIFEEGLDAIVMRGTGILNSKSAPQRIPRCQRLLGKIFRQVNSEQNYQTVLHNCLTLLQSLNTRGRLFAIEENIFSGMPHNERISALDRLTRHLTSLGFHAEYDLKEHNYENEGWATFIVTLRAFSL